MRADNFEILRDCRVLYLRQLDGMLRNSQLLSEKELNETKHGASEYFDEVVSAKSGSSFVDEANGLTSSHITLLGHDDLEIDIRLDNFSSRLLDATGNTLWRLHLRFVTLLRRPDLPKGDNPVGPKGIARGLKLMFEGGNAVALDQKLDRLQNIEDWLLKNLPAVYEAIDVFLNSGGVDAAQAIVVNAPAGPKTKAAISGDGTAGIAPESINALIALQTALLARLPGSTTGITTGASSTPYTSNPTAASGAATHLLGQAALDRVFHRLSDLDHAFDYRTPTLQSAGGPNNNELFPSLFQDNPAAPTPRSINSAELGIPAHAPEGLAIDTLSLIFEAIFDDPNLQDGLKAALSSLQITMLKLAIRDAGLFSEANHPARQVIDKMAKAMIGLPIDTPNRHPMALKLFEIAGRLRSKFTGNIEVFCQASLQLDTVIQQRQQEIAIAAEPYLPFLQQLDQCDRVAREANQVANPRRQPVPLALQDFFARSWPQVMQQVQSETGPNSQTAQEYLKAINTLLWSFEPKTDLEQRKELSRHLPFVLKILKAGMVRIALPPKEQQKILDTCFDLQTQALRGGLIPITDPEDEFDPLATTPNGIQPVGGELKRGGLSLLTQDFPTPVSSVPVPCQIGDWIARANDPASMPLMVVAISPESQRHLMFNPLAGRALSVHPVLLARQLNGGEKVILGKKSLFESAANRALNRQMADNT